MSVLPSGRGVRCRILRLPEGLHRTCLRRRWMRRRVRCLRKPAGMRPAERPLRESLRRRVVRRVQHLRGWRLRSNLRWNILLGRQRLQRTGNLRRWRMRGRDSDRVQCTADLPHDGRGDLRARNRALLVSTFAHGLRQPRMRLLSLRLLHLPARLSGRDGLQRKWAMRPCVRWD